MSLFAPGEVIFVESDQAANYKTRMKYHVCVCGHRGRYFFINSKTWEGSFRIIRAELPALSNDESFIACNTLLRVSDKYLTDRKARSVGNLPKEVIERLLDHINTCDVLTEEEKEDAIDGLSGAL